jgi:hypothetical protein
VQGGNAACVFSFIHDEGKAPLFVFN